jgi:hypothetical protein
LLDIIKNEDIHDVDEFNQEEMANAIVTDKNDRLFLRVSEIDDLVEVNLNGQRIDDNKWNGADSGWIDLTKKIAPGANLIQFLIKNGPYEGCGGHFQLSAGIDQYDYAAYLTSCPPNQAAFRITYTFVVERNGQINLGAPNTILKPGVDWKQYCSRGCLAVPQYTDPN